jgi:hypothetical protein
MFLIYKYGIFNLGAKRMSDEVQEKILEQLTKIRETRAQVEHGEM